MKPTDWQGSALISPCGQYRYRLRRMGLSTGSKRVLFVMLNPSTADAWCSKCRAKLDPNRVAYWTASAGPFCSMRCADGARVATSLQREAVQFPRCDECPRPGHFHGKACWVFTDAAEAAEEPRC